MNKKIIEALSEKFRLPEHVIENIAKHPFKFQADLMKQGDFKPFRHQYLGVFAVKPGRVEAYNAKKNG
tara:strand:- start:272 stop:475 length:204 start_codon:yes stop_codon:yes gene_type:complete